MNKMKRLNRLRIAAAVALSLGLPLAGTNALAQPKPRIEKAADLPRFSYPVQGQLEDIVRSAERFAPFAQAVRRDTESVLTGYDIPDKATQRDLLNQLAALDFLDARYDACIARLDQVKALQEKPADKLTSGMRLRAMAQAAKQHGLGNPAYLQAVNATISAELKGLPFAVVENNIKSAKASAELMGEALYLGQVRNVLQPVADANHSLSNEMAPALVNARLALVHVLPLKAGLVEVYSRYLAANQVQKPDIWAARDVVLPAKAGRGNRLHPVNVAVWDSGVDTSLFGTQVLRDAKGQPALIAFDKYSQAATGELHPIPDALRSKLPQLLSRTKGFSDLQANIDSPESSQVKQLLSTLAPDQYKTVIEELGLVGNYEHGTHVAGIALAGNPHARLAVARIEFGHTLMPDPCPSVALAQRDAANSQAYVEFFKKHKVRVVNMSWGGDVTSSEQDLEKCNTALSPEARKALARQSFDISKAGLIKAFASAPQILFVAAAGNSNSDASFVESMPADIVLPNLITVGAVDKAGEEAPFTSFGPTVKVHANGYQVESYLPGGARVALSGTSMAAPQVTNLAAKLLAVNPKLTPIELIKLITSTADRPDARRVLMNPKKAVEGAR